jgi:hypothetical protein
MWNPDYVDNRTNTLYCSRACALKGGARKENIFPIGPSEFEAQYEKGLDTGDHYGALCPICEYEYHGMSQV